MKDFTKGIMVGFAGGLIYAATNLALQGYRVDDDGILRYKREDHQESESLSDETDSETSVEYDSEQELAETSTEEPESEEERKIYVS